jgi:hypothetical protein
MPQDSVASSAPAPYLVVNCRNPTVNRVPPQLYQISMRNKTRIRTSLVPKHALLATESRPKARRDPALFAHFSLCGMICLVAQSSCGTPASGTVSCGTVHRFAWTVIAGASQTAPLRPSAPRYRRPTSFACDIFAGQPPGLLSAPGRPRIYGPTRASVRRRGRLPHILVPHPNSVHRVLADGIIEQNKFGTILKAVVRSQCRFSNF